MPRLTQKLIDSLRPEENRDRIVFDEMIPGFGVRVYRSGRKSFVVQYHAQKRTRRFTLGNCNILTPLQTRKKVTCLHSSLGEQTPIEVAGSGHWMPRGQKARN